MLSGHLVTIWISFHPFQTELIPRTIYWKSPISILGLQGLCDLDICSKKWQFANRGDPDQMLLPAASDLCICPHCLPITQQPLYNIIHYNTVLDITQFKDDPKNV